MKGVLPLLVMNFWEYLLLNVGVILPVGILVALLALLADPLERLGDKIWSKRNRKD